jgi:DNA repair and recombination RAD54-like protein
MQKQKDSSAIIVLDSDDEDEYTEGCEQLTSENNKQQAPSGLTSPYTTWIVSSAKDQVNGTLHVDGVQSTQIVPYGQNAPLINQFPLQTSWQPSIQYERVILQKRPEEQRVQDLVVCIFHLKFFNGLSTSTYWYFYSFHIPALINQFIASCLVIVL